jgi:hypothetical protein
MICQYWKPGVCGSNCGDARHAELERARSIDRGAVLRVEEIEEEIRELQKKREGAYAYARRTGKAFEKLADQDMQINAANLGQS